MDWQHLFPLFVFVGRGLICRHMVMSLLVAALLSSGTHRAQGALLEYRDWSMGTIGMIAQSITHDQTKLYVLGESSTPGIYQVGMLISENAEREDFAAKNKVLLECGMHAREWYASESCYWFIDYLLQHRRSTLVRDLLANTDIWVIPQSNPAGRAIDDLRGGNPTQFIAVCSDGDFSKLGKPCDKASDCGEAGKCFSDGWRTNANRTDCAWGVDLARNFSSGWDDALATCEAARRCDESGAACTTSADCASGNCVRTIMKYRGPHPFSEPETLNLRRFVHNHMISMVAISHTNNQELWNRWRPVNGPSSFMTDQVGTLSATGSEGYKPDPKMDVSAFGGGLGQFSAWLTRSSDVSGADGPDFGTARNISTFYFELPIKGANYYGTAYENTPNDGSNSFHPSSDTMKSLWKDAIRDILLYVTRQARSPQCPVDDSGNRVEAQCLANDFGLVGAKLAAAEDQPGLLDYDPTTREEILPRGTHRIVFAVQNFSSSTGTAPTATKVWVFITKDGTNTSETVDISLSPGQRKVYSITRDFEVGKYRVEISIDPYRPDDFTGNNTKIFAFRVVSPYRLPNQICLGATLSQSLSPEGTLNYQGNFPVERRLNPSQAELRVVLYGHRANPLGSKSQRAPTTVSYVLPKGSPWWEQSKPSEGLWIYSDPNGLESGVRSLVISQPTKQLSQKQQPTKVSLEATDGKLKRLAGAQSYRLDFDLPRDNQRLSSLAKGTRVDLLAISVFSDRETELKLDRNPNGAH